MPLSFRGRRIRASALFVLLAAAGAAALALGLWPDKAASFSFLFSLAAGLGLLIALAVNRLTTRAVAAEMRALVESARAVARSGTPPDAGLAAVSRADRSVRLLADELEAMLQSVATERDRFIAVLEGMSDAVIAMDKALRVTLVNRAAIDSLGIIENPRGRPLADIIRVPELREKIDRAARHLESATLEFDLPGPTPRRLFGRVTPVPGGGHIVVLHDISELRRLETVRRDFASNVSHELRTPISVIRANAETLLAGALDEPDAARPFAEAIYRNADRLANIINDLLELSRIESGNSPRKAAPVSAAGILRRAAEALEPAVRARRHRVRIEAADDLMALGDAKALDQVMINLIDNAVKYTPEQGEIVLSAAREGDRIRLSVTDNGPGIEPRHRPRIFERFYRVDPGRSRDLGGTGLGLAIVKHLVEAMGGQVGVDAVEPHGSIFWIALPSAPAGG
ncbi:PAS domain-containing protein [bacterium]|nr:PAS domain-containing protein [bacterium]